MIKIGMITCFLENERKTSLRHVTVDAIVTQNSKLVMVKRSSDMLLAPNKYALPGGFLDRDETATEGVLREVYEETGYKGKVLSLFRIIDKPDRRGEDRQNVDLVFIVKALAKVSQPDHEVEIIKWFSLNKLPDEDEVAFDHYETLKLFKSYQKESFALPILG